MLDMAEYSLSIHSMRRREIQYDSNSLPSEIRSFIGKARFYDSSCSEAVKTIYISGDIEAFLKTGTAGSLYRERRAQDYLCKYCLSPQTIVYTTDKGCDYLLSSPLNGEDAISGNHPEDPQKLAASLGTHLRHLHSIPLDGCPFPERNAEMLSESRKNIAEGYFDSQILKEGFDHAAESFEKISDLAKDDVIIHGDYCLPNIIMNDFALVGFVDLGGCGIGDRHYDLFWGSWSLNFNLGTYRFTDIFLTAYGKKDIDPVRLELCRYLAAFTK